ncbi:helix-turn-helix transcriptional regulator [Gallibacterium sp. ZY190522]
METTHIQKYYSIKELTDLGIGSRSTIDRLVKAGKLTRIKLGSSTRFSAEDVQKYLSQQTNK